MGGCVRGWKAVQGRRQERWTKMGERKIGRGSEREESHEGSSLQYFIC